MNKLTSLSKTHFATVSYIKEAINLGNLTLKILKYIMIINLVLSILTGLILLLASGPFFPALLIMLSPLISNSSLFIIFVNIKQRNAIILINAVYEHDGVKENEAIK